MEGQQKPSANVSHLEAKLQEVQERLQVEDRYGSAKLYGPVVLPYVIAESLGEPMVLYVITYRLLQGEKHITVLKPQAGEEAEGAEHPAGRRETSGQRPEGPGRIRPSGAVSSLIIAQ